LAAAFSLVLVASAMAEEKNHVFVTTFGGASSVPPNPYPLGQVQEIAVDNSGGPSAGDIYATDPENFRVEKFNPAGELLLMFGWEVNKTKSESPVATQAEKNVCVIASGDVCQAGADVDLPGGLKAPRYITVDSSNGPSSGDIYVGDNGFPNRYAIKYDPSGHLVSSWGEEGRLDVFILHDVLTTQTGEVIIQQYSGIKRLTESGEFISEFKEPGEAIEGNGFDVNSADEFYEQVSWFGEPPDRQGVLKYTNAGSLIAQVVTNTPFNSRIGIEPTSDDLYVTKGGPIHVGQYDGFCGAQCAPMDEFGAAQEPLRGIAFGVALDRVYTADLNNEIGVFKSIGPRVSPPIFEYADEETANVSAHLDPHGNGPITECRVDYGPLASVKMTGSAPCSPDPSSSPPGSNFSGPQDVTAHITGLAPGTGYRYRFAAVNEAGAETHGLDKKFGTAAPPSVITFTSRHVTATSAELSAVIHPHGANTSYRFEYGTATTALNQSAPVPDGQITSNLFEEQEVSVNVENLKIGSIYRFRVVAENEYGETKTNDQTFGFYPPNCPNQAIRQLTGANDLPDCRGYELVTPADSGNALIFPSGTTPSLGRATNPSRLAYVTWGGVIPGINGNPPNTEGDQEIATRTDQGWVSKYVGLSADVSWTTGGPPYHTNYDLDQPDKVNEGTLSNPSLSRLVVWNTGEWLTSELYANYGGPGDFSNNAPYVYDTTTGKQVDRWPTNLGAVPGGESFQGETIASGDLSHFVFSADLPFAPGGTAGDVYDNDTTNHSLTIVNRASDASPLAVSPAKVSEDGSHILLSGPTNPCGRGIEGHFGWYCSPPLETCQTEGNCTPKPVELYVRVDDSITYEIAPGHKVSVVGMTPDMKKIYFTSSETLLGEDTDTSEDLYMWSEEGELSGEPLTLISIGNGGSGGNSDTCESSFSEECGVLPITFINYAKLQGGLGGNGYSDTSIAAQTGEIYFFSPEHLAGTPGITGAPNLYVYRHGELKFVATFEGTSVCTVNGQNAVTCSDTPVSRMNISPDGQHVAFIAISKLTPYDNHSHTEVYSYEPEEGRLTCDSCLPDGSPPRFDVRGSQNGLFMADDGRTFFTTSDALVPQDTNETEDVYEFVDSRPQLISSGTSAANEEFGFIGIETFPGLVGVTGDGRDVYFATFDVLVGQDQNGEEMKVYDARSAGGFPFTKAPPGCAAADECHGAGSTGMQTPADGTGAGLGSGGNAKQAGKHKKHAAKKKHRRRRRHHKRHHKRHPKKSHRRAHRGGGRRG
jgi:hypothetical protein